MKQILEAYIKQDIDLSPLCSRPGIMYDLAKISKIIKDDHSYFRPILLHIQTCKDFSSSDRTPNN